MRALVQRVTRASVEVEGRVTGQIERGLLVLVGVSANDGPADAARLAEKVVRLRCFPDDRGAMNLALGEVRGAVLAVSQFTLYGDTAKGHRPSFVEAAPPDLAERLYRAFVDQVVALGIPVAEGVFRAHMQVSLVNDGPVTLLLETGVRPA
ncbi:MAG: D-aminoacyl-tRNA deacylase [Candidatus Eisenbacteria bacterium]